MSAEAGPEKLAKDLADGISAQSKNSNKVWLALIAAATLTIFPEVDSTGKIRLPFSLGLVDAATLALSVI